MIDLIVKDNGETILNRDVKKDEKITYQNSYLESINKVDYAYAMMDLSKNSKLKAGYNVKGKVAITSEAEDDTDNLMVKIVE